MCSFFDWLRATCKYLYPSTCISHWNPNIHINTAHLITTKRANNRSFFKKRKRITHCMC